MANNEKGEKWSLKTNYHKKSLSIQSNYYANFSIIMRSQWIEKWSCKLCIERVLPNKYSCVPNTIRVDWIGLTHKLFIRYVWKVLKESNMLKNAVKLFGLHEMQQKSCATDKKYRFALSWNSDNFRFATNDGMIRN